MQRVLQWLAGVYVVELGLRAAGLPIHRLELFAHNDPQFAIWQPITHLLIQGSGLGNILHTAIGVVVVVFFLPALHQSLSIQQLKSSLTGIAGCAVLLPYLMETVGLIHGVHVYGWQHVLVGVFALYGLARPHQTIYLFFVLPVPAWFFVWGTLGLCTLAFIGDQNTFTTEALGAWCGAFAWWQLIGPGSRRRALLREASRVEKALERFDVLEGGLSDTPPPPEEWH